MEDELNRLIERLVRKEQAIDPDSMEWQIHEYLVAMRVNRKPKTVEHARRYLHRFRQWCAQHGVRRVQELQPRHLREWQLELLEQYSSRDTVWSISCDVRAFLNWCVQEGILKERPFRTGDFVSKPKPKPKPMSPQEVQTLIESLKGTGWLVARNRALLITLLYTGARRGEVLQMRVGDLDGMCFTVTQKGDRQHVLHLTHEVVVEINRYLRLYVRATGHRLTSEDLLWRSPGGSPLTGNGLRQVMKRLSERTGVDVWCHRLRATCATWRIAKGAPTKAVQEALGHSDLKSIEHYAKLAEQDLKSILEQTSPLRALDEWKRPR